MLIALPDASKPCIMLLIAAIPNSRSIVLGEPYAGGVAPQAPIGKGWSRHLLAAIEARGRYAALQTSYVGVDFAELPRCLY
jgi:hypothetical protein